MRSLQAKANNMSKINNEVSENGVGIYRGITKKGAIKVVIKGKMMEGQGTLYKENSPRKGPGIMRKLPYLRTLVYVSPQFPWANGLNRYIRCTDDKATRQYVFYGVLSSEAEDEPVEKLSVTEQQDLVAIRTLRKSTKDEALQAELAKIGSAYRAGLNPAVKLRHAIAIVQRSKSSIYQKIQMKQFPAPHKQGNGSFWFISEINSYLLGSWQPPET